MICDCDQCTKRVLTFSTDLESCREIERQCADQDRPCRYWYSFDWRDLPPGSHWRTGWAFGRSTEEARASAERQTLRFSRGLDAGTLAKARLYLTADGVVQERNG